MFLDAIGHGGLVIDRILAINMEYEKQAPSQSRGDDNAWQQAATAPVWPYSDSAWAVRQIGHKGTIPENSSGAAWRQTNFDSG